MKELYFVRHGQTEWNAIRRMQGQMNSNLNDRGRAQADVNGQFLATRNIEALFASPLDRTRQTAEIVNQHLSLPIAFDERIMEWDCGDWSGHMYDESRERWLEEWTNWRADPFSYRGPGCENYPDMINRSRPFLAELSKHPAERIAIVSHGMIGRVMVSTMLEHDAATTLSYGQDNDVIFRVTLSENGTAVDRFIGGNGPEPGLQ